MEISVLAMIHLTVTHFGVTHQTVQSVFWDRLDLPETRLMDEHHRLPSRRLKGQPTSYSLLVRLQYGRDFGDSPVYFICFSVNGTRGVPSPLYHATLPSSTHPAKKLQ